MTTTTAAARTKNCFHSKIREDIFKKDYFLKNGPTRLFRLLTFCSKKYFFTTVDSNVTC